MTDPSKKVKNTLFNASVTGVTLEDFSQNAVLMPAMEKQPPPILNITADSVLQRYPPQPQESAILDPVESLDLYPPQVQQPYQYQQEQVSNYFQPTSSVASSQLNYHQEPQEISFNQQPTNQTTSKVSSVLSSFSSYLNLGGQSNTVSETEPDIPIPAPAGLDNLISQENSTAPPVPLFPSIGTTLQPEVTRPPPTGPVNTFRRPGLKRAVYAQPPGLTGTNSPQVPQIPPIRPLVQPFSPPQSYQGNFLQPQPTPSPPRPPSSSSSIPDPIYNPANQFKPISPLPSNFSSAPPQVPYPQHSQNLFSSSTVTQSHLGPVMDAIPDSEALPSQSNEAYSQPDGVGYSTSVFQGSQTYRPVYHHWFFKKDLENKEIWQPFSMVDSLELEHGFTSNDLDPDKVIPTDGRRYDVNILRRQRSPVYWTGKTTEVRRCSWFYKSQIDSRYVPYEENVAAKLEEEYKMAFEANQWQKKVELGNGETVMFHGPDTMVLFPTSPPLDSWGNVQPQPRPRVVKRGMDEFNIDEGESAEVDHILFMVHGIGSFCDLSFRKVEAVVDDFRIIATQLVQSHYKSSCEKGIVNRVEVLPISWHQSLHSEETGIDQQLKKITLESLPKLREFTNDTILDVLLYTSPVYCQKIVSTVGDELNRIFDLFQQRNPTFRGGVSLGGHSLGSLVLFDLLSHQRCTTGEHKSDPEQNQDSNGETSATDDKKLNRRISYMMGNVGAGQPKIMYPHLSFQPKAFFALGSPIGMFISVRGLNQLGEKFALPTCPAFFNIFHPYDPIAYRIEALVNPALAKLKPVLIPHHKGRKRMHLELKETMARVGADLKQKVFDSMKNTWNSLFQIALFNQKDETLEAEVNKTLQKQLEISEVVEEENEPILEETTIPLGNLNKGRRIDYILQEAPFEIFNEYIFALKSHVCYWDSEDTALLILKEIYNSMDITADDKVPQQSMTIERTPASPKPMIGMDPTFPIQAPANLPPPPTSGFVRKT